LARCEICESSSSFISAELGACLQCIRNYPERALALARQAHIRSRSAFGLPLEPPRDTAGILCTICANQCQIPEGGLGYCGLRWVQGGEIEGASPQEGRLSWYHDPLPTNCVADWVCPGGTGSGYPRFAHCPGPELGYSNLAVFFHACNFNCLFCQNWHFRKKTFDPSQTAESLVSSMTERTSCICYFGGDPSPQLPFALEASRQALERRWKILRICWETNGSMNPALLSRMLEISLVSGGCMKFDLKAWNDDLHRALTGASNNWTLENFARAGEIAETRKDPPLLVASTLLVPGYIDEQEIRSLAGFVASIDPEIPYSLLAYYPQFYMADLPLVPRSLAQSCLEAAREEGLRRIRLGNTQLLGRG
jgi:pyruvate formate lyase activating enzyme